MGRIAYIRKGKLQNLYTGYRTKKLRGYKKNRSFGGSIPLVENMLSQMGITIEGVKNCGLEKYEELKDIAIESIGKDKKESNKFFKKYEELKIKIGNLTLPLTNKNELASQLGTTRKTLHNWREKGKNIEIPKDLGFGKV